jgi:hypothetical protein
MFRSKVFWGSVLGVVTSVLTFEGRINLAYSPLWTRVLGVLTLPGTRFANAVFSSGVYDGIWAKVWSSLAIAANLMVYAFFWFVCIWITSYFRERRHPYDRQSTLVPPSLR